MAATARGARPLVERCILEHEALMGEAGILGMIRRTGYLRIYRSAESWIRRSPRTQADQEAYGVNFQALDRRQVAELEPHLSDAIAGGMLMPDPVSVGDPGARCEGLRRAVRVARRLVLQRRCAHACRTLWHRLDRATRRRVRSRLPRRWWRSAPGRATYSASSATASRWASSAAITGTSGP